jgi:NADH-quinone oxidoreductase subunit J
MVIAFYIFAFLAVAGALLMVTRKNPLGAAFALVVSIVALAGLFAMLMAEFIFVLQILVYAGAIMVLIIFTIMLLNLKKEEIKESPVSKFQVVVLALICAACAFGFIEILSEIPSAEVTPAPPAPADFGSIESVGRMMLSNYLYPFEVISVLLLAAIVGVVLLAKRVI